MWGLVCVRNCVRHVFKSLSEYLSQILSEYLSRILSEILSEILSQNLSQILSEYLSEILSEYLSQILYQILSQMLSEPKRDNWKVSLLRWCFHTLFGLKKLMCPASGYLNPLNFESFVFYQYLEQTYANRQQLTSEFCRNCPHLETKVNHSLRIESILSLAQGIFNASLRWSYLLHVTPKLTLEYFEHLSSHSALFMLFTLCLCCIAYATKCFAPDESFSSKRDRAGHPIHPISPFRNHNDNCSHIHISFAR